MVTNTKRRTSRRPKRNKRIKTHRRRGGSKGVSFEGDPKGILRQPKNITQRWKKPLKWVGKTLKNYLFEPVPNTSGATFNPDVLKKLSDPKVKELIKQSATDSKKLEQLTEIINKLSGNNMDLQVKLNKLIEEHTRLTNIIEKGISGDCKLQKQQLCGVKDKIYNISGDVISERRQDTDITKQSDKFADTNSKYYESTKELIRKHKQKIKDIEQKLVELKQKIQSSTEKLRSKISIKKLPKEQVIIEIKPIKRLRSEYDKKEKSKEQYEELVNKLEKSIENIDKAKLIEETIETLKQNNKIGKGKLEELNRSRSEIKGSNVKSEPTISDKVSLTPKPVERLDKEPKLETELEPKLETELEPKQPELELSEETTNIGDDVLSAEDYVEGSDPWEQGGGRKQRKTRKKKSRKTIKKSIKKKRKSRKRTNRKR